MHITEDANSSATSPTTPVSATVSVASPARPPEPTAIEEDIIPVASDPSEMLEKPLHGLTTSNAPVGGSISVTAEQESTVIADDGSTVTTTVTRTATVPAENPQGHDGKL
jgi:hypothetical protein